jgi:PhnB protein
MTDSQCANAGKTRLVPQLTLKNCDKAIEHYKKAFGAVETHRMMCPVTGVVAHAGLKIGDVEIFLGEERPEMGCHAIKGQSFYLYVPNADEAMKKAVDAGLTEQKAAADQFWGDRMGTVTDPYGITWNLGTHVRDVTRKEMEEAMKKMVKAA